MTRVLVIALQEATRDLIDPWVERGLLPNMAALMQVGTKGHVHAQAPLITPHSWANILTGVDGGQHGVFDFWQRGADGVFKETSTASLQALPIWARLRGTGLRSTLLNLPMTWPPPKLNGNVVAGRPHAMPARELFSSPDLYDRLIAAQGNYRVDATTPGGRRKADFINLFDIETPRTSEAFEFLLNAEEWDFAMVYFVDVAMAQHYFWADMLAGNDNPYRDIIASAYVNADAAIGRLVRAAGRDTIVFVISECGAGPLPSGINLNNWLEQQGLLRSRRDPLARLKQFLEDDLLPAAKRVVPSAVKLALTNNPFALKKWASSSGPQPDLDWTRTKVFSCGKEGNIFVNLASRDPGGIVQPGVEYDELLKIVTKALSKLENPDSGAPVVNSVARPQQLYTGPAVEFAPDLIVDWTDGAYMTTEASRANSDVFVKRWRRGMSWPTTGSHRYDGVLIVAGPGIAAGAQIGTASQFDLLPTWLKLLDQPVPGELKGRVLAEMMEA
jgi:predicted AlkP superfamily phosphohydrolase/phosphomutase